MSLEICAVGLVSINMHSVETRLTYVMHFTQGCCKFMFSNVNAVGVITFSTFRLSRIDSIIMFMLIYSAALR